MDINLLTIFCILFFLNIPAYSRVFPFQFEHHQEMLEKFTEKLSELSEQPLESMDRTNIVNHTRVVQKFVKGILKYVEDGMDDDI